MSPKPDAASLALLREEIARGRRIGIAVSGGGDSMALMTLLADAFGPAALAAVTVDHRLRDAARDEAEAVAAACRAAGISHDIVIWQGWDGTGNLQGRARDARYDLISEWARHAGIRRVTLGHTRDDVAETVMLGLARAAGLDGLCGMRAAFARGGVDFLRPLLTRGRAELRRWLTDRGIAWIDDPSNDDPAFDRVRMRNALSVLNECGVSVDTIARCANHLADDRDAIRAFLAQWAQRNVRQDAGDLCIDRGALGELAPTFSRRIIAVALRWITGAPNAPRAGSIATFLAHQGGTLGGCLATSEADILRIGREPAAAARSPAATLGALWDGRWRVDGPGGNEMRVAALGSGIARLPLHTNRAMPNRSLSAGPAVWRGNTLISAPLAGYGPHRARLDGGRDDFVAALHSY